jgi:hypothetical protein
VTYGVFVVNTHPLGNPAWFALSGPQAGLARRKGRALRFQRDFGPFYGMPDEPAAQDWADAAAGSTSSSGWPVARR